MERGEWKKKRGERERANWSGNEKRGLPIFQLFGR